MLILALLSCLGAVLSFFESMLPILTSIPGGKLGIANAVTVIVIYTMGSVPAIIVSGLRAFISCLMYGGMNAFMYSFAGAILSCVGMILVKSALKDKVTPIGVCVVGAALHNIAQVAVAFVFLKSDALIWYLAMLLLISVVSGAVCGYFTRECMKRIG